MVDRSVATWLDAFFATVYACWPVDATFIGVREHDWRLPDYSENGAGDAYAQLQSLLGGAAGLDAAVSRIEAVDRDLAEGVLRVRLMELESQHFHRGNPSLYTGDAVFGVLSLLLTDFAPPGVRLDAAAARLEAVPLLLRQGRSNVRRAPLAWTERALRECGAARVLLTRGLDRLLAERGERHPSVLRAADAAARAFAEYATYLDSELRHSIVEHAGVGVESFFLILHEAHALEGTADALAARAEAAGARMAAALQREARALGETDSAAVLERLAEVRPTVHEYYARFGETWLAMRDAAETAGLVTWPDFPIRYVPLPVWVRDAAAGLYYLPYRSPAPYALPEVHEYHVPPIEAEDPPQRQEEMLRLMNDGAIKLNHVIHHGGLGHHVQNCYAYGSRSRIGRVAGVDCAARIAMTCGGTMAEGWACYATDLMDEAGALTRLESFANRHAYLRMCARAVVDVRLHQNVFTIDDAAAYYMDRAGMPAAAARTEAVRNSMYPGAALIYFVGLEGIHALRRELESRQGSAFSLRAFHDELLSYGSIPVARIAAEMLVAEAPVA